MNLSPSSASAIASQAARYLTQRYAADLVLNSIEFCSKQAPFRKYPAAAPIFDSLT